MSFEDMNRPDQVCDCARLSEDEEHSPDCAAYLWTPKPEQLDVADIAKMPGYQAAYDAGAREAEAKARELAAQQARIREQRFEEFRVALREAEAKYETLRDEVRKHLYLEGDAILTDSMHTLCYTDDVPLLAAALRELPTTGEEG